MHEKIVRNPSKKLAFELVLETEKKEGEYFTYLVKMDPKKIATPFYVMTTMRQFSTTVLVHAKSIRTPDKNIYVGVSFVGFGK